MLKSYVRTVAALSRGLAVIATALLVSAMLVVCQMIAMRYVFRAPTVWQTDFVVFSATAAIFLGAPYVLLTGGHVGVDLVELMLGSKARARLRIAARLLGLAFCAAMFVASWIHFHEAWAGGWRHSSVWGPPLWPPLTAPVIGFAVLCLQYVAELLAGLAGEAAEAPHGELGGVDATALAAVRKEPQ